MTQPPLILNTGFSAPIGVMVLASPSMTNTAWPLSRQTLLPWTTNRGMASTTS
jgi:hypothetical protein